MFRGLRAVPVRELIPSVTCAHNDARRLSPRWEGDDAGDLGLSGKWG
ncbi:MAG: hypothetical protein H0V80_11770, partial [Acidobacteria bacterium]|nr:hypothetical protein [Acidobacteriota bacterium]